MTGNPSVKSYVCSPGAFSTKGFFKKTLRRFVFSVILSKIRKHEISELRNFLRRRPFGRPIPVWGPAAAGGALRYVRTPRSVGHPGLATYRTPDQPPEVASMLKQSDYYQSLLQQHILGRWFGHTRREVAIVDLKGPAHTGYHHGLG